VALSTFWRYNGKHKACLGGFEVQGLTSAGVWLSVWVEGSVGGFLYTRLVDKQLYEIPTPKEI